MSATPLDAGDDVRVVNATAVDAVDEQTADETPGADHHTDHTTEMSMAERMHGIDQSAMAMIAQATQRKLGNAFIDEIQRWAVEAKHSIVQNDVDWSQASAVDPVTIRQLIYRNQVVRLEGVVQSMTEPVEYERVDGQPQTIAELAGNLPQDSASRTIRGMTASLTIANEHGEVQVEDFYDANLVAFLQSHAGRNANVEALVLVSLVANPCESSAEVIRRGFVFHLIALRPLTTALQIVRPVAGEEQ